MVGWEVRLVRYWTFEVGLLAGGPWVGWRVVLGSGELGDESASASVGRRSSGSSF